MKVEIVDGTLWHLFAVMQDMRDFERANCEKLWGANVEQEGARILSRSLLAYACIVDGECVAVWGVAAERLLAEEGYLWLLGTRFLERHPIAFLRHSRLQLDILRQSFSRLYGTILTELNCGEKWLRWLGFEVGPDEGGIRGFMTR